MTTAAASIVLFVAAFSADPVDLDTYFTYDFSELKEFECENELAAGAATNKADIDEVSPFFGPAWVEILSQLQEDWDNYGALPPSPAALANAKYFEQIVGPGHGFTVKPMSNGSVAFYHSSGSFLAEIEFDGSGMGILSVVGAVPELAEAEEFRLLKAEILGIPGRVKEYERKLG